MGLTRRAFISQEGSTPEAVRYVLESPRRRALHQDVRGRLILNRPMNTGAYSLTEEGVSRGIHVLDCRVEIGAGRASFTAPFAAVDASEWDVPADER